jgi:transcriptional regulator with XRE-family HTH domain
MSHKGMISAAQIRAARGLLDWSRKRLSEESGVPFSTLSDFEVGRSSAVLTTTADKLVAAFDRHGVVFIGTKGVTFK